MGRLTGTTTVCRPCDKSTPPDYVIICQVPLGPKLHLHRIKLPNVLTQCSLQVVYCCSDTRQVLQNHNSRATFDTRRRGHMCHSHTGAHLADLALCSQGSGMWLSIRTYHNDCAGSLYSYVLIAVYWKKPADPSRTTQQCSHLLDIWHAGKPVGHIGFFAGKALRCLHTKVPQKPAVRAVQDLRTHIGQQHMCPSVYTCTGRPMSSCVHLRQSMSTYVHLCLSKSIHVYLCLSMSFGPWSTPTSSCHPPHHCTPQSDCTGPDVLALSAQGHWMTGLQGPPATAAAVWPRQRPLALKSCCLFPVGAHLGSS